MLAGKSKVVVDTTALANGDSIAAYLTSAAGTLVTHTTNGSKQALDVYGADVYAEDSAHSSGHLGSFVMGVRNDAGTAFGADGDYVPFSITSTGALRVDATVNFPGDYAEDAAHTTADVGIFNLAVRRDARSSGVDANGDYASFNVNANGELWVFDSDANTTLTAILADTATIDSNMASLLAEVQALSHAEDVAHVSGDMGIQALAVRTDTQTSNAAAGDYTSLQTWSEGALKVVDIRNGALLQQRVSVATTATALPTTALANRKSLLVQNAGNASIWVGSATVTDTGATAGIEVPKGAFIELDIGPAVSVYGIAVGSAVNANVLEAA